MEPVPWKNGALPPDAIPEDALAACTDLHGEVRLDVIARMLGQDEDQARQALGTLVFDDPATGALVPAGTYLSGQVRRKLGEAVRASVNDPRYRANVRALLDARPPGLRPGEITTQLGAPWVGKHDIEEFTRSLLEPGQGPGRPSQVRVEHPGGTVWHVTGPEPSALATAVWGTGRYPAPRLIRALLEQRPVAVHDIVPGPDGPRRVLNVEETRAALEKASAITERFALWARSPQRAARFADAYNIMYDDLVPPSYEGARLSLPGLSARFTPEQHQADAIARILAEPATGVFRPGTRDAETGVEGTRAVLIMAAMELRRLGKARKPLIAVPRPAAHAAQFPADFRRLYPEARILSAGDRPLTPRERERFLRQAADGDWDAVIVPDTLFAKIPVPEEFRRSCRNRDLAAVDGLIAAARADGETAVLPRLEAERAELQERLDGAESGRRAPAGPTMQEAGFDAILLENPRGLQNLATASRVPSERIGGSERAADIRMKTEWARDNNHKVVFSAPYPPANGDVHTLLRYLQPGLLRAAGMLDRDAWLAGHALLETEIDPLAGPRPRVRTTARGYVNVPEMMTLLRSAADISGPPPPAGPVTVTVEPTARLKEYFGELAARADRVRTGGAVPGPDGDSMLRVFADQRRAAIDLRLVGRSMDGHGKLHAAAGQIAALHAEHQAPGSSDAGSRPGPVQLVFCRHPGPRDGWNAYDELRRQLAARGIPASMVRLASDADGNGEETARLAEDCRDGRAAVVIASDRSPAAETPAVQQALTAVHYLDVPVQSDWNRHQALRDPSVKVIRYAASQSPDALEWDAIDRSDRVSGQLVNGPATQRTVPAADDGRLLTLAEAITLVTGPPSAPAGQRAEGSRKRKPQDPPGPAPGRPDRSRSRGRG